MNGHDELRRVTSEFHPLLARGELREIATAALVWAESGLTVRTVRGRKMRSIPELFNEFAAAFQFPLYFGENKDAFDECISELEGVPVGTGHVVLITEPDQVLSDAEIEDFSWLVGSFAAAAQAWAQPIERGEWWDRPAIPFHVVLAGDGDIVKRAASIWARPGHDPTPFGGLD